MNPMSPQCQAREAPAGIATTLKGLSQTNQRLEEPRTVLEEFTGQKKIEIVSVQGIECGVKAKRALGESKQRRRSRSMLLEQPADHALQRGKP